ncbi:MAG: cupin domain-containing protein [Pseudonocardiales bacterium]|nr:MAG: cupin domain-containing protein [Pseudonocardiales bacterium]
MSFPTESGEISAIYRAPADVPGIIIGSRTQARLVAPGSLTGGQFGLFEWNMPGRAGGPDAHFHKTFSESFYILSGTVKLYDGARWVAATPGDFLYVPAGGIHAFHNDADVAASMLILFAPGAPRERYFQELADNAATGRTLTEDEWTELFARHDQYRAGTG